MGDEMSMAEWIVENSADERTDVDEDDEFKCRECGDVWDFDDLAEDSSTDVTPPTSYLNRGEPVKAKKMDGEVMYGDAVLLDCDYTVSDWPAQWTDEYETLYEAWVGNGLGDEVGANEGVVKITVGGSGEYAFPESRIEASLTSVSGVGEIKEEVLKEHGVKCIDDLRASSQDWLASIDGIGPALAARIKADVGSGVDDREVTHREKQFSITYECPGCGHTEFWASKTGFNDLGVCGHCDGEVVDSMEYIEEGDGVYCSIDCLNEMLAESWDS